MSNASNVSNASNARSRGQLGMATGRGAGGPDDVARELDVSAGAGQTGGGAQRQAPRRARGGGDQDLRRSAGLGGAGLGGAGRGGAGGWRGRGDASLGDFAQDLDLSVGPGATGAGAGLGGTVTDGYARELPAGAVLSERYVVRGLLGQGGMGVVYRATALVAALGGFFRGSTSIATHLQSAWTAAPSRSTAGTA